MTHLVRNFAANTAMSGKYAWHRDLGDERVRGYQDVPLGHSAAARGACLGPGALPGAAGAAVLGRQVIVC